MKRFVEGEVRGQGTLLPEHLLWEHLAAGKSEEPVRFSVCNGVMK